MKKHTLIAFLNFRYLLVTVAFAVMCAWAQTDGFVPTKLGLNPGSDITKLGLTWWSASNTTKSLARFYFEDAGDNDTIRATVNSSGSGTTWHKVTVEGLTPGKAYIYQVSSDGTTWSQKYDYTAPTGGKNFTFAAISDVQIDGTTTAANWKTVATKLKTAGVNSIVHTGDQVDSDNSTYYGYFFDPPELRSIPFAPVMGNHDLHCNFTYHYNLPNEQERPGTCNNNYENFGNYYYLYNNILFIGLNTGANISNANNAITKFQNIIQKAKTEHAGNYDFIVVLHHKSTQTIASHAADADVENLVKAGFEKIMTEERVSLVLAGHDHINVRSKFLVWNETENKSVPNEKTPHGYGNFSGDNTGTVYLTLSTTTAIKNYSPFSAGFGFGGGGGTFPYLADGTTGRNGWNGVNTPEDKWLLGMERYYATYEGPSTFIMPGEIPEYTIVDVDGGTMTLKTYLGDASNQLIDEFTITTANIPKGFYNEGPKAEAPVIAEQSTNETVTVDSENPVTLTVNVGNVNDGGTVTYQWFSNTTESYTNGTAIVGAVGPTLTVQPAASVGTTYYYVVVTNTLADATPTSIKSDIIPVKTAGIPGQKIPVTATWKYQLPTYGPVKGETITAILPLESGNVTSDISIKLTEAGFAGEVRNVEIDGQEYAVTLPAIAADDVKCSSCEYYLGEVKKVSGITVQTNTNCGNLKTSGTNAGSSSGINDAERLIHFTNVTSNISSSGGNRIFINGKGYNNTNNGNLNYVKTNFTEAPEGGYYMYVYTSSQPQAYTVSGGTNYCAAGSVVTPVISAITGGGEFDVGEGSARLTASATASDNGTLTYQWYRNTSDSNDGGTEIPNTNSATYDVPTNVESDYYYYVVVTNTLAGKTATSTSNTVQVTVLPVEQLAPPVDPSTCSCEEQFVKIFTEAKRLNIATDKYPTGQPTNFPADYEAAARYACERLKTSGSHSDSTNGRTVSSTLTDRYYHFNTMTGSISTAGGGSDGTQRIFINGKGLTTSQNGSPYTLDQIKNLAGISKPSEGGYYMLVLTSSVKQSFNVSGGKEECKTGAITKTTPIVTTLPTATPITQDAALSTSALNGGVAKVDGIEVEGTFAWTDGSVIPPVGTNGYEVTFTPTNTTNYNTATATVQVVVNAPTIGVKSVTLNAPTHGATYGYVKGETVTATVTLSNNKTKTFTRKLTASRFEDEATEEVIIEGQTYIVALPAGEIKCSSCEYYFGKIKNSGSKKLTDSAVVAVCANLAISGSNNGSTNAEGFTKRYYHFTSATTLSSSNRIFINDASNVSFNANTTKQAPEGGWYMYVDSSSQTLNYNVSGGKNYCAEQPKISISGATVNVGGTYTYTGVAQTPSKSDVTVTLAGHTDVTFDITKVESNIDAGTATVTVTGTGDYEGTVSGTFTIVPKDIGGAIVAVSGEYTYTGAEQTPSAEDLSVTLAGFTPTYSVVAATNNIDAGEATVTLTGTGNFAGTVEKTFTILPKSIEDAIVAVTGTYTYTGAEQTPTVDVTLEGFTPTYDIAAINNTDAGEATVTVTGTGNFAGTVEKTFAIAAKSIEGAIVAVTGTYTYTGSAQTPSVDVTIENFTPTYDIAAINNTDAGEATVTVTGTDNFTGTVEKTFAIAPKGISDAIVTVTGTYTYTGAEQTPSAEDLSVTLAGFTPTYSVVAATNNIDAGEATVTLTGTGNFAGTAEQKFTIGKAPLTVTVNAAEVTYGDAAPAYEVTYDGFVNGETAAVLGGALSFSGYDQGDAVGSYDIIASGLTSKNYDISYVDGKLTVNKAQIAKPTLAPSNLVYNGKAQSVILNIADERYTLNGATQTDADDYTAKVVLSDKKNTKWADETDEDFSLTWKIAKAPLTVTADDKTITYGDDAPRYTVTYSGFVNNETAAVLGGTLSFESDYNNPSNVGDYKIIASGLTSNNYEITYKIGTLTVNPASGGGFNPPDISSITYSPTLTLGDIKLPKGYEWNEPKTKLTAGYGQFDATYTKDNYEVANGKITVNVDKAQIAKPTLIPSDLVYNGVEQSVALNATGLYTLSGATETKAGKHSATVALNDDKNYEWEDETDSDDLSLDWEIAQAKLTVKANDETVIYGADAPAYDVTYSGFVNNETAAVLGGTLSFESEYNNLSNVGDYKIIASGLTSTDYDISYVKGTLTVNKAQIAKPELAPSNLVYNGKAQSVTLNIVDERYTLNGATQTDADDYIAIVTLNDDKNYEWEDETDSDLNLEWIIAPAKLTVKANDETVIYGADAPAYDVTYSGFVNNETAAVLGGTLSFESEYNNPSNIGDYKIIASGLTSNNYDINYVDGKLTVNKAQIAQPELAPSNLVYNGKAQSVTLKIADERYTLNGATQTDADDYTAKVVLNDKENTEWIDETNDDLSLTWKIAKAPLTITANDATVTYGEDAPGYTAKFSAFVNNETKEVLAGALSVTSTYAKGSDAKTYDITASGLTSINYEITYKIGTLTVSKAQIAKPALVPSELVYNGKAQSVALDADGLYTLSGETQTNAGKHTATVVLNDKTNYEWADGTNSNLSLGWEIAKTPLTVTAVDKTTTYGSDEPNYTATYTGFVNDETKAVLGGTLTLTSDYKNGSDAKTYDIIAAGLTSNNYAIAYKKGTLTVKPALGDFGTPSAVKAKYSPTLTLNDVKLPTGYKWNAPTTSLKAGNGQTFLATYTDVSGNYIAIPGLITVDVAKATPEYALPENLTASLSNLLSSIELPKGWSWSAPETAISNTGTQAYKAIFTPDDKDNYEVLPNIDVTVEVASNIPDDSSSSSDISSSSSSSDTSSSSSDKSSSSSSDGSSSSSSDESSSSSSEETELSSSSEETKLSSSSSEETELSSSSEETEPSSSSGTQIGGEQSPIRLPQTVIANQAVQIYNGINLQVTNGATVEVYNLFGSLISRQNFSSGVYVVSFEFLPKGMYIVKTSFGSEKKILKVPVN